MKYFLFQQNIITTNYQLIGIVPEEINYLKTFLLFDNTSETEEAFITVKIIDKNKKLKFYRKIAVEEFNDVLFEVRTAIYPQISLLPNDELYIKSTNDDVNLTVLMIADKSIPSQIKIDQPAIEMPYDEATVKTSELVIRSYPAIILESSQPPKSITQVEVLISKYVSGQGKIYSKIFPYNPIESNTIIETQVQDETIPIENNSYYYIFIRYGTSYGDWSEYSFPRLIKLTNYSICKYRYRTDKAKTIDLGFDINEKFPYTITIDWGEKGTDPEKFPAKTKNHPKHIYQSNGTYDITIECSSMPCPKDYSQLIKVYNTLPQLLDETNVPVEEFRFTNAFQLDEVCDNLFGNNAQLINLSHCFENTLLHSIPEKVLFGLDKLKNFSYGFTNTLITEVPSLLFNQCRNLEDLSYCFSNTEFNPTDEEIIKLFPDLIDEDNDYLYNKISDNYKRLQIQSIPNNLLKRQSLLINIEGMFMNSNLLEIPVDFFSHSPKITNVSKTFKGCRYLRKIPVDENKNSIFENNKQLINLSETFMGCMQIESIPVNLFHTTTKINNFESCFNSCLRLKFLYEDTFKYTRLVTNAKKLFFNCTSLTLPPSYIFYYFNSADLSRVFKNSGVKNIYEGCFNSKVLNVNYCFKNTPLKSVSSSIFINCEQLTELNHCFENTNLEIIPAVLLRGCSNLEKLNSCFKNTKITNIPINLFYNNPAIKDVTSCFEKCKLLTNIYDDKEESKDNCSIFKGETQIESFDSCFKDTNIEGIPTLIFEYQTSSATNFDHCFENTPIDRIPNNLFAVQGTAKTFNYTFAGCKNILEIPENLFKDSTSAISFEGTFKDVQLRNNNKEISLLFEKCISAFNFDYLFSGSNIEFIDPLLFHNNTKAISFNHTFENCYKLQNLGNIFKENINSTQFNSTFKNCYLLNLNSNLFMDRGFINSDCDFNNCFENVAKNRSSSLTNIPKLWELKFKTVKHSNTYTGINYNGTIENGWA